MKFRNNKLNKGLAKHYIIKIEILVVYIKIPYFSSIYLLFNRIISNISRGFSLRISSIN